MSEISEDCYAATWLIDLEFILWNTIQIGPCDVGFSKITYSEIFMLKKLSEEAEGWFYWPDRVKEGPVYVTMEEWNSIYEKRRQRETEARV